MTRKPEWLPICLALGMVPVMTTLQKVGAGDTA
jgi:hypothetical protein